MKADRVSLHGAQNRRHSGPPWALWRNGFCLAACLAERHVQGRKQGTTARHGTRVIVGHRLSFDNVRQIRRSSSPWDAPVCHLHLGSAFGCEADIIRAASSAELVENDPQRASSFSQKQGEEPELRGVLPAGRGVVWSARSEGAS
jgi:hypothetical protein